MILIKETIYNRHDTEASKQIMSRPRISVRDKVFLPVKNLVWNQVRAKAYIESGI